MGCGMSFRKILACLVCVSFIAGCAGREAQKIAVVQNGDFSRNCESLHIEADSNNSQIKSLIIENSKKQGANAVAVVAGALFLLPLFALNLKGAAKAEYEALIQRNQHLANIAASQEGCEPIKVNTLEEFREEINAERKATPPSANLET